MKISPTAISFKKLFKSHVSFRIDAGSSKFISVSRKSPKRHIVELFVFSHSSQIFWPIPAVSLDSSGGNQKVIGAFLASILIGI